MANVFDYVIDRALKFQAPGNKTRRNRNLKRLSDTDQTGALK